MICIRAMRMLSLNSEQRQAAICAVTQSTGGPDPARAADSRCSAAHSAAHSARNSAIGVSCQSTRRSTSGKLSRSTTSRCALRTGTCSPPAASPSSRACSRRSASGADGSAWNARSMAVEAPAHWPGCCRSRRHPVRPRCAQFRLDARPAERRGVAAASSTGDLPPVRVRRGGDQRIQRLLRRTAGAQQGEPRGPSRGSVRCCVSTAPTPAAQ